MSLLVPPTVTESPVDTVQVLTPNELSLNCTADGLPLPSISWVETLSDGTEIEYTMASTDVDGRIFTISSTSISSMLVQSVFTISSSVVLDTSNYSCRATNEVGDMNSTMTQVFVYGKL